VIASTLFGCRNNDDYADSDLTFEESRHISEYVKKVPIEQAVGQLLMVGLPADINTVRDSGTRDVDRVLLTHQVGFVIPKQYTYFDDGRLQPDEYLGKIVDFNNAVQSKALKGPLGLPVIFATDFEGPIFTPIKRGLIPPPSAIALGATQDKQALIETGGLVGFQLRNIGIHILLGPVLDIYNIRQGNKNGLQDRSFASTPDGVARTASNFMHGVKQSGLMLFAKHYPSHGAVETNPHDPVIPRYEGSNEQRIGELKPYEMNKSMIDGIMTSHIEVDTGRGRKMATFSSELLGELAGNQDLTDKIYITDDLSNMGAVRKYMAINGATYADIAIQAFDAGHDLLMFAHLSKDDIGAVREKTNKPSNFRIRDFEEVVSKLTIHIKSNRIYEARFRKSLEKLIRLKARVAKQYRQPVEQLLKSGNRETPFHIPYSGQKVIEKTEENLMEMVSRHAGEGAALPEKNGIREHIVISALQKSAVEIKPLTTGGVKILDHPNESRILFVANENDIGRFNDTFSPHFPLAMYLTIPTEKSSDKFRKLEQSIATELPRCDQLIFTVYDESDADLLSRLRNRHGAIFSKKTLILLHTSPAILDSALISDTQIIGTFTRHPMAIDVDIEILLGHATARGLENLPVNVGDNGKYYSVSNTKWVMPADDEQFEKVFAMRKELESCVPVVKKKYHMIPASVSTYTAITIVLALGALIFMVPPIIVRAYRKNDKAVHPWYEPLASYWVTSLGAIVVTYLLLVVVVFPGQAMEFIRERMPLADQISSVKNKFSR
jgi:beta-glucosidase-like glycosyl hydrolase